jgi:hypothetical protein
MPPAQVYPLWFFSLSLPLIPLPQALPPLPLGKVHQNYTTHKH